jgi:ABC-2 type transport system permease protein
VFLYLNVVMLRQQMRLVADWWLAVSGMIVEQATAIAFIGIIFYRIETFNGWELPEMVFLLGLFVLSKPLYRLLFQGVIDIPGMIVSGSMDHVVTKPVNPLILILSGRTNPVAAGDVVIGVIYLVYSTGRLNVDWHPLRILYIGLVLVGGSLVYVGTLLIKGAFCIFVFKFDAFHTLLQQFQQYAKYPITIYHPVIRIVLVTALPYALASSVPAAAFLSKGGIAWIAWFAPLFCVLYFAMSSGLFLWCLRYYRSTGS